MLLNYWMTSCAWRCLCQQQKKHYHYWSLVNYAPNYIHVPLDDACSGKVIFCPNANDKSLPHGHGYYSDLLGDSIIMTGKVIINYKLLLAMLWVTGVERKGVGRKLEVFRSYYCRLIYLDFKLLCPHLVTARIISYSHVVLHTLEPSRAASHILEKISTSLQIGINSMFDEFYLC